MLITILDKDDDSGNTIIMLLKLAIVVNMMEITSIKKKKTINLEQYWHKVERHNKREGCQNLNVLQKIIGCCYVNFLNIMSIYQWFTNTYFTQQF